MSNVSNSIERYIKRLAIKKCIGKRFTTDRYSSSITFNKDGPCLIESLDFSFITEYESGNYENMTDYSTPSYDFKVSGTNLETNKKFTFRIDIRDIDYL